MARCNTTRPLLNIQGICSAQKRLLKSHLQKGLVLPDECQYLALRSLPLAGIEECHSHNLSFLVPDHNVAIGNIGIIGMAGHLEVYVEHIGQLIVIHPDLFLG